MGQVQYARVTYYCVEGAITHYALIDSGSSYSLIPRSLCASIDSMGTNNTISLSTANGNISAPLVNIKISVNGSPPTQITGAVIDSGVYTMGIDEIRRFHLL
jgi:predicted aspartyl protease